MNLLHRIWQSLLLLTFLTMSQPSLAGDITVLDGLGFQGASDVVSAKTFESDWQFEGFLDQQEHIELQPEQSGLFHGKRRRLGLNIGTGIWDSADISLGIRQINESISRSASSLGITDIQDRSASLFSLAIRQNILKLQHMQWAAIPYIEPAFSSKESFGLRSKSRIGGIFVIDLDYQFLEWTTNFGFRHRPVEYYGNYRISNDYHFGSRLGLNLHPIHLHGEFHERNMFVLSTMNRRPSYERQVSQYHKLIASVDFDELRCSLFWGRAVGDKTFGVPGKQIGIALSWNFRSTTDKVDVKRDESPAPEIREDLPPLQAPEELAPETRFPEETLPQEHEDETGKPELNPDIRPQFPDSERLDRLEEHLSNMSLVEESSPLQTLSERELMELQLGEAQIRRLRSVDEKMDEKKSLDRIRQKMHDQQKQPSISGDSSAEGLLDQLDSKLEKSNEARK